MVSLLIYGILSKLTTFEIHFVKLYCSAYGWYIKPSKNVFNSLSRNVCPSLQMAVLSLQDTLPQLELQFC